MSLVEGGGPVTVNGIGRSMVYTCRALFRRGEGEGEGVDHDRHCMATFRVRGRASCPSGWNARVAPLRSWVLEHFLIHI